MKKIDIPAQLVDAMREQRVILLLGSGASLGSLDAKKRKIPTARQLASDIAEKFLNERFKSRDLMRVSELALSQAGENQFNQWLRDYFEPFEPTSAHLLLPKFRWRLVATTNYDLLVEKAYQRTNDALQSLVPRVKDNQPIDTMLRQHSFPLEYVKLHGCVEHVHDADILLVLTPNTYNNHEANRQNLYSRIEELGREYPMVFCGHSLDDLHIRRLVENSTSNARPMYYLVSPEFEPEEITMWATRRVTAIPARFDQFLASLFDALPPLLRVPPRTEQVVEQPYRKYFRVSERESDETAHAFQDEFTHLFSGMPTESVKAERFYSGYDQSWGAIQAGFDVQRRASMLLLEFAASADDTESQLAVISGAAGFGKSIALRRAAFELATSFNEFVIWMNDDSKLKLNVLKELNDLIGRRIFAFVDRAALNAEKIEEILAAVRANNIPLTLVTAERRNEWSMFCQRLEKYAPTYFEVGKLSPREVSELLEKLEHFGCLGALSTLSAEERFKTVTEKLDRQLLVTLHEITRGKPFADIVFDEFDRVEPEEAQQLYLDICTLHRFDVPVRAGAISRISQISFRDFEVELFEPLRDLVLTSQNSITGDWEYRTRHALVSEILFNRVCVTDEARRDQLVRLIDGLDCSFRSDEVALSQLARGRTLAETFEEVHLGREVFEVARVRNPRRAFLWQQNAVYEYSHASGDLALAEQHSQTALAMEPENPSLRHTHSTVLRRRSLTAESEFAKRSLRTQARKELDKIRDQSNPYVLSGRAKLRVDDLADILAKADTARNSGYDEELGEAIEAAELALHRAFNMYPEDPEFLEAKAKMKSLLGEVSQSTALLKRAFAKSTKGTGIARRLARRLIEDGELQEARQILETATERDPTDRSLFLILADIRFIESGDFFDANGVALLSRSCVNGDREHHSRFVMACHKFVCKDFVQAYSLFADIEQRAPSDFYPTLSRIERRWMAPRLSCWSGRVKKMLGGYLFLNVRDCPKDIFAPVKLSEDDEWDRLQVGTEVEFDLDFSRKGPLATGLKALQ
ncbi:SIR2 family protein [Jannaschia aquimarina]|uniref:P-loop NTPase n=1 Tax=Jannaschia aquimarina TaxID=935700 RepID=UPI0011316815|nr:SIR2 family protein [Jannaschia aquimarina]